MKESNQRNNNTGFYIGFMSGTSYDGVDASLIRTDGEYEFESICDASLAYDPDFRKRLRNLQQNSSHFLQIEEELTKHHIKAGKILLQRAKTLLKKEVNTEIVAIGFHGQTIKHIPEKKQLWQIGNPHMLANELNIDVVHDFRRRDLALGGQGAPLIPVFHKLLARKITSREENSPSVIVNIGGVANLTYIDKDELIAFDTGPGNALIDDMMLKYYGKNFDDQGQIAKSGNIDHGFIKELLSEEYYSRPYPKSLDRERFSEITNKMQKYSMEDVIANLTYLTAAAIAKSIQQLPKKPERLLLCGGGAKNQQLLFNIEQELVKQNILCPILAISAISDINVDYVESQGFAYLAARFIQNLPSAFPMTTGAKQENICGCLVNPNYRQ